MSERRTLWVVEEWDYRGQWIAQLGYKNRQCAREAIRGWRDTIRKLRVVRYEPAR